MLWSVKCFKNEHKSISAESAVTGEDYGPWCWTVDDSSIDINTITKAVKLWQYQHCASPPVHTQAASPSFLPPFKGSSKRPSLFLSLLRRAGRSMPAAILSHLSLQLYEPDMIYAVPLTSLSPSSLTRLSSLLSASSPPPHPFCSPLASLHRALCPMGIRDARLTTSATARRGKPMRRSSWLTMWDTFRSLLNVSVTEGKFHPLPPVQVTWDQRTV